MSHDTMNDEIFEKYLIAGRAVAKALGLAKKLTRSGTKFIDIAELCEQEVKNNGATLGFPINIGLDNVAAHYSPPIDDITVVPDKGLLKIDIGSSADGYIADAAITINIGEEDGIYKKIKDAADKSLEAALKLVKPGVDVLEIGSKISQVIAKYDVKPISNLGGHGLKFDNLHAEPFIPNVPRGQHYKLKEGMVYAIEPFTTNGYGAIKNGTRMNIYEVAKVKKKNMKINDKALAQKFKKVLGILPFSPRAVNFIKKDQVQKTIDRFVKMGVIRGYNVFIEMGNGIVAQKEHTFIVTKEGAHVTTVIDNGLK